jgi:CubicO group peptidase (beta-lactamase class C family)
MRVSRRGGLVLGLALGVVQPLPAQSPAIRAPEAEGLSASRLARLDALADRLVEEGEIAGAVLLVARHGEVVHLESHGQLDREAGVPMRDDAIFRICSMSKTITSVAVMVLYEEGRFLLDDPVARFLPEFERMRVIAPAPEGAAEAHGLVPAARPITILDLLTHTSGISYRFFGLPVIADLYAEAGITDGLAESQLDLAENVRRIAAQPLLHHPGERFSYGLSTDVLGRLVEVVSGVRFGEFLRKRIFEPLDMPDTGFVVPEEKRARLASIYRTDRAGGLQKLSEGPLEEGHVVFSSTYPLKGAGRYESGGAGMVSTASDYARFAQMLLNGGELDGTRLLSRKTVELMTADHITELAESPGHGFGLGVALSFDPGRSGRIPSEGTLLWSGFYTTRFWIDPAEEMVGLVMTQTYPYDSGEVLERFQALAYQAIAD